MPWLALAVACSSGTETSSSKTSDPGSDPTPPTDETTPPTCSNPVVATSPEDGDDGVFYRSALAFELADPDPTAVIAVTDPDGDEVPGESTVDGAVITWRGDPLRPNTDYRATLTHACGSDLLRFGTSDVGSPVDVDLVGRTYALDAGSGVWNEPAGAGPALAVALGDFRILLSVLAAPSGGAVDLLGGVGYQGSQNLCEPTLDLAGSAWTDPFFSVAAPSLVLATQTFAVTIEDFATTGAFSADGTRVEGATMSGVVDTRALGPAFGLPDEAGALCELVAALGASCEACGDGEETCLRLDISDVAGPMSPVPLVERTAEDILSDPACN
ncbi:MAG: Ig-like domain-containing protein [Myxococcota bacterium]